MGVDAVGVAETCAHLFDLGVEVFVSHADAFSFGQSFEGQAALQPLGGLTSGGLGQVLHGFWREQLLHVHALLSHLGCGFLQQAVDLLFDQAFGQLHLELIHQGLQ